MTAHDNRQPAPTVPSRCPVAPALPSLRGIPCEKSSVRWKDRLIPVATDRNLLSAPLLPNWDVERKKHLQNR